MKTIIKIGAIVVPLVLLVLSLSMCRCSMDLPLGNDDEGNPIIRVEVAWRTPVVHFDNFAYCVEGNTAYIPSGYGVTAINLDNGEVKWRLEDLFATCSEVIVSGDYLYIFEDHGWPAPSAYSNDILYTRMAKISKEGALVEMMQIGPGTTWNTRMFYLSTDGQYLYWGSYQDEGRARVVRFDPTTKERTVLFTTTNEICGKILIDDGKLYVGHAPNEGVTIGTLTVINLADNSILWEKTPRFSNYLGDSPLHIKNDRLYVFDSRGIACYDRLTGAEIYDTTNAQGAHWGGPVFDKDYAYYTSPRFNMDKVNCINYKTGELIWGDVLFGALGAPPHVNEGVLYVATQSQMRLYDAMTGEVLGVDPTVEGHTFQLTPIHRYKDLMLVVSDTEMIAVRMNYHKRLKRFRSKR